MKKLYLPLLIFFFLFGCTPSAEVSLNSNTTTANQNTTTENFNENTTTTPPYPISLQALAEKTYNGHSLTLGNILATTSQYTRYYITYYSGDLKISGIMNVPSGEGPFPVLILNHGYIDPAIYTNGRGLKREQDYLARQGYVVIHPDYRGHAESDDDPNYHLTLRFGYTEDVINAVYAVLSSNLEFFDKENVGMLGHSMGGGITQNILVAKPNLIKAAVLFAPVSTNYIDNFNKWTRQRTDERDDIIAAYGEPTENPEFWYNISPINFLDEVQVPVMFHHGNADESVPLEWSETTVDKLTELSKDVTFYSYNGEPHEFIKAWPLVMQRTVEFFDQHLK